MGKIGFISISHEDYINDIVTSQADFAKESVTRIGHEVVAVEGQVTNFDAAVKGGKYLVSQDVDGVVIFLGSWVECPIVMAAVRAVEHLPICIWGFPMCVVNGKQESTGSYVSFAMFQGVMNRVGYAWTPLLATPCTPEADKKLDDFCAAAVCKARLKFSRVGLIGYTSMSIYTGTFDHVFMRAKIGPEIDQLDSYTLIQLAESFTDEERDAVIDEYRKYARIHEEVNTAALRKSAGVYLAMKKLVEDRHMDAINVKCQYEFSKEYKSVPCVPLSLLAEKGCVASCEGDILNTVSMLILHYLTGQTIAYGDSMNHHNNVVKFSSCGFLPFSVGVPGEQLIRNFMPHPGFNGIQSSFVHRPGRVTVIRLVEDKCDYHIVYMTDEGLATEKRQGYMPALDVALDGDVNKLISNYAGQHYAICYGDISGKIEELAAMLHIKTVRI